MANITATSDAYVLQQLHDIHIPAPIGWWPLAPGWYGLILLILALLITLYYWLICRRQKQRAKQQALLALAKFKPKNSMDSMFISELLKRVALAYYPRAQVAGLTGTAWLNFLNCTSKGLDFHRVQFELLELPYQSPKPYDLTPLIQLARAWIKQRNQHV